MSSPTKLLPFCVGLSVWNLLEPRSRPLTPEVLPPAVEPLGLAYSTTTSAMAPSSSSVGGLPQATYHEHAGGCHHRPSHPSKKFPSVHGSLSFYASGL